VTTVRYVGFVARKDITMNEAEIQEFLSSGAKVLEVATLGKDGSPHLAPMWFVMDDDRVVFRSFSKSQKIINLMRDPRLTVLVETGDAYSDLQGVMIKGTARLVTDPNYVLTIYGGLAARYPMVGDSPVDLDDQKLEAAFGRFAPKNTAVVVEPIKVTSWDHTKLGGAY
jgi:PPOX class probable F420-dependent enzyme